MIHIVSLSGGMDSSVLLAHVIDKANTGSSGQMPLPMAEAVKTLDVFEPADTIIAISVDYGQRHRKELEAAALICNHYDIQHVIFDMREPFSHVRRVSNSSLLGAEDVPHGYYSDENMKSTIVPNRNMMMTSLMVSYADAMALACDEKAKVWVAVHMGDHAIYPDCRPDYLTAMHQAIWESTDERVQLVSPFTYMGKDNIAEKGLELGVPFKLTWTCYEGGEHPCGRCGTCVERIESFVKAGVPDPVYYEWDSLSETLGDLIDRESLTWGQARGAYPGVVSELELPILAENK